MREKARSTLSGFEVFYPPPGTWSHLLGLLEDEVESEDVAEWLWWFLDMEDWRSKPSSPSIDG